MSAKHTGEVIDGACLTLQVSYRGVPLDVCILSAKPMLTFASTANLTLVVTNAMTVLRLKVTFTFLKLHQ